MIVIIIVMVTLMVMKKASGTLRCTWESVKKRIGAQRYTAPFSLDTAPL